MQIFISNLTKCNKIAMLNLQPSINLAGFTERSQEGCEDKRID